MRRAIASIIMLFWAFGLFGQHSLRPDVKIRNKYLLFNYQSPLIKNPDKRLISFWGNKFAYKDTMNFFYNHFTDSLYTSYNKTSTVPSGLQWFSIDSLEYDEYGRTIKRISRYLNDNRRTVKLTIFDDTAMTEITLINQYKKDTLKIRNKIIKLMYNNGRPKNTKQYYIDESLVLHLTKEIKYNQNGLIHSSEDIASSRIIYVYDTLDLLISKTTQTWKDGLYIDNSRIFNTIENATIETSEEQIWDKTNQLWQTSEKLVFTYYIDGHVQTCIDSNYYVGYSPILLSEYSYNLDGQLLKCIYKQLDTLAPIWRDAGQADYWYKNGVLDSFYRVYMNFSGDIVAGNAMKIAFNPSKTILSATKYRNSNGTWGINDIAHWYYEDFLTDTKLPVCTSKLSTFCIPNPANNYVTIHFDTPISNFNINIFSPSGNRLFSKKIQHNEQVNISKFPKGLYFYTVSGKDFFEQGQFIKQ